MKGEYHNEKNIETNFALILAMAMCLSLLGISLAEDQSASEAEISAAESVEAETSAAQSDEEKSAEQSDEAAAPEVTPQDEKDDGDDSATDDGDDSATDDAPDEEDIDPDTPRSGSCGANLTWAYNSGVLTVQGSGAMNSYQEDGSDRPWEPFKRIINRVVVENGATSIGDYAFADLERLSSVELANSVTSIGAYAFAFDSEITSVPMRAVTSIGESAFAQCSSLSSLSLPSGLTTLSDYAFSETALTSVTIPGTVQTVSEGFYGL